MPAWKIGLSDSISNGGYAGPTSCYFLSVGTPEPLDQEMVQKMFETLFATEGKVTECLQALGVMAATEIETAPWKVVWKGLRSMLAIAVVIHSEKWSACTCYYFCRRGHCPHHYAISVRLGHMELKSKLPHNPRSDMKDADGSSAEDAPPKRKRKRQRPSYRPMPAPVLPASAPARPEPTPGKVLKPQQIAKSPFNK